jgi:hypothetical protein
VVITGVEVGGMVDVGVDVGVDTGVDVGDIVCVGVGAGVIVGVGVSDGSPLSQAVTMDATNHKATSMTDISMESCNFIGHLLRS